MALCLRELVTNAIKYGALSTVEGRVSVVWTISDEELPVLSIEWLERGGPR